MSSHIVWIIDRWRRQFRLQRTSRIHERYFLLFYFQCHHISHLDWIVLMLIIYSWSTFPFQSIKTLRFDISIFHSMFQDTKYDIIDFVISKRFFCKWIHKILVSISIYSIFIIQMIPIRIHQMQTPYVSNNARYCNQVLFYVRF